MIEITSLSNITDTSQFDDNVLQNALREINRNIKTNASSFRLLFNFQSTSNASRLYKNSIVSYFLKKGFKTVIYPTCIFIDWSKTDVYDKGVDSTADDMKYLGEYFNAQDIYLILTDGSDLRNLSYRVLYYYVFNELKRMNPNGISSLTVGISTTMTVAQLNAMFAPEIYMLNQKFPNTQFTFLSGGTFQISLNQPNINYTDIPEYILFGSRTNI